MNRVIRFLQNVSAWLAGQTPVFITLVAVLAFKAPQPFAWVKGDAQTVVLGVIMLTMGMTLTSADFRILAHRPLDIFIAAIAQYTIMPLLAFGISHVLGLPRGIAVGLILVGCCPGGVSSNIMSFLCKGDVAFSVGMTTASTLLAPLMTPFLMLYLAGESVDVDAAGMFKSILIVTIIPVAVGFVLNYVFGRRSFYSGLLKIMPGISVIGLAFIVGGVIAHNGPAFFKSGLMIFIAIFLHNTLGYILGYTVGIGTKMSNPKKRTISIEIGMQNAGLATVLAAKHFPQLPEAAVASAVSCVWHSITGALLAGIFNFIDSVAAGRKGCK